MCSPLYFLQALKINHSLHAYPPGNSKSEPEESHTHSLGNEFQIVANQGQRFFPEMLEEALSSTLQGETINSTCWGRPNSLCVEHTFSLSEEASVWQRRIWLPGNDQAVITTHTKQPGYFPFLPGRDLYSGQPVMLLAPEKCLKSIPYLRSGHPRRKTWAKISNASYLLRQCSQEKLLMEFRIGRKKKQKGGGYTIRWNSRLSQIAEKAVELKRPVSLSCLYAKDWALYLFTRQFLSHPRET